MTQQNQQQPLSWTVQYGNRILHFGDDGDSNMAALFSVLDKNPCGTGVAGGTGIGGPAAQSLKDRNLPASFFCPGPAQPRQDNWTQVASAQHDHGCEVAMTCSCASNYGPCSRHGRNVVGCRHDLLYPTTPAGMALMGCCGAGREAGEGVGGVHGRSVSSPAQLALMRHSSMQQSGGGKAAVGSISGSSNGGSSGLTVGLQGAALGSSHEKQHVKQESLDTQMLSVGYGGGSNWDNCPYSISTNRAPWEVRQPPPQHQQQSQIQQDRRNNDQLPNAKARNHNGHVNNVYGHQATENQFLVNHTPSGSHHAQHYQPSGEISMSSIDASGPLMNPLPPGWVQDVTSENEVYFINHNNQSTSWNDPRTASRNIQAMNQTRLSQQQQQQQQQQHKQQQQQNAGYHNYYHANHNASSSARRPSYNEHYFCVELQRIQKEKERLQHVQENIALKEMLLNKLVQQSVISPFDGVSSSGHDGIASAHPTGSACGVESIAGGQVTSSGMMSLDMHVRQSSADSGLGGMGGTTYSLPRSPEEYLSNVDEMDAEDMSVELSRGMRLQTTANYGHCYGGIGVGGGGGGEMYPSNFFAGNDEYSCLDRRDKQMTEVGDDDDDNDVDGEQLLSLLACSSRYRTERF